MKWIKIITAHSILLLCSLTAFAQNDSIQILFQKNAKQMDYKEGYIDIYVEEDTVKLTITNNYLSLKKIRAYKKNTFKMCVCIGNNRLFFNELDIELLTNSDMLNWDFEIDTPPFARKRKKAEYQFVDKWCGIQYVYNWIIIPNDFQENIRFSKVIHKKDRERLEGDCRCGIDQ